MDPLERAKERLAILTVIRSATQHRHEVVEAIWASSNDGEASQRLREIVDFPDGASAEVILDQQMRLLTKEGRDAVSAEIGRLRQIVERPSD